jgi:two-component system, chemotaxis family, sensor kinase CheA
MSGDDIDSDFDAKILAQMFEDFLEESQDFLDQLNLNLTQLEENPEDGNLVNEIFRVVHTLKGTASFVGIDNIREIAHRMEDVFGALRKGELKVTTTLMDVMFEATSMLTLVRDGMRAGITSTLDISPVLLSLIGILETGRIDIYAPVPDEAVDNITVHQISSAENAAIVSETIRVATNRLDTFMNLVGEMITSVNRLNSATNRLRDNDLNTISSTITRLTKQLHSGLMIVRMVRIERLFNKFPGVVRNLARELEKEVEFVMSGKETELDKTVTEQIYDPLMHLLRNAIDHGIEKPDKRREMGKSPAGKIRLNAWHEQNSVIIEIADDGRGIDAEEMRRMAIRKGITGQEAASALTDNQAINLIFLPGFSRVETVTGVSGRGVGMDVVRENIHKLRGTVDVDTTVGTGTSFRLRLPLTLAILQILLVRSAGSTYALPLNSVSETLLVDASDINTLEKNDVIFIRGTAHPLISLSTVVGRGAAPIKSGMIPVVLLGLAEKKVAVSVDELLDKQDVVMKPLGEYLGMIEGVEGAAILADGSVTLIINVEFVMRCL